MLLGVVAGVSFVVQQTTNAKLRTDLGSPAWAAFVSYLGGTVVMGLVVLATREPAMAAGRTSGVTWWAWSGGFFGAIYIVISILLLPRLGAATVVALIVLGQMLGSIAFDNWGAFGLPRQPLDVTRLLGAVLLMAGVFLVRR
jgi:transporter family-2 protein